MAKISVLMPVRNCGPFLQEAVDSILRQSFTDFELLIIDDGSTDGSQQVIGCFGDSRIRFYQNTSRLGVARTLNKGLDLATGEFIARMDGDDISRENRLEHQLRLLDDKPGVGLCGSWVLARNGQRGHVIRYPSDSDTIQAYTLYNNPVAHPAVMFRRDVFIRYDLRYDPQCGPGQDYELWSRGVRVTPFVNLKRVLVDWRIHDRGVTQADHGASNDTAIRVQSRELARLRMAIDDSQLQFHRAVGSAVPCDSLSQLMSAQQWLQKLLQANKTTGTYPRTGLGNATGLVWFRLCMNSARLGSEVCSQWWRSPLRRLYFPNVVELAQLVKNCFLYAKRKRR